MGPAALKLRLLAALALLGLSSPVNAGDFRPAVDRYLRAEMQRQHIPGIALAVLKDGKPLYVKGYGAATLEHPVAVAPSTVFQLGSIGKQFTAVAVMMLADEHKLNLDDPLSKYLPEVPSSWSKITLRLMLNHQAGISQYTTPRRQLLDVSHDYSDAELIQLAISQPLDFEPGTDVSYSDVGYVLLGFVINRVAGEFYGDFLQQRIFKPLNMSRTRIISDANIIPGRASGYELRDDGTLRNQTPVAPALNRTADGSLYSTVIDLMKWDRALDGDSVLPQGELERMWRVDAHRNGQTPLYHYGYGWENSYINGRRVVEYDGNWQGFQAVMSRYPDQRLTVILLTNLALCRTERLGHSVAGLVDPALTPYPESIADTAPARSQNFQNILSRARETAVGMPLPELPASIPTQTLRRDLAELGPILHFSVAADHATSGGRTRVYRVEGRDMVNFYTVRYGADSKIQDLELFQEF
ncbi:MAG: serine hydrolase domain-containing protein [Gammaproteobacteria bacterium]